MLTRLTTLYGAIEFVRSAELQRQLSALRGTELAIQRQAGILQAAREAGCAALLEGNQMEARLAETDVAITGRRGARLRAFRNEQERSCAEAESEYQASRIESEQMKRLRNDASANAEIADGRRIQAVADDRFLARRRWMERRPGGG